VYLGGPLTNSLLTRFGYLLCVCVRALSTFGMQNQAVARILSVSSPSALGIVAPHGLGLFHMQWSSNLKRWSMDDVSLEVCRHSTTSLHDVVQTWLQEEDHRRIWKSSDLKSVNQLQCLPVCSKTSFLIPFYILNHRELPSIDRRLPSTNWHVVQVVMSIECIPKADYLQDHTWRAPSDCGFKACRHV